MKFRYWALKLCAIIILIFILQQIFPAITENFKLVSADILTRPWILFTSIFLHSGILHLCYNLFALALFGTILEKIIGSKRFLILFIVAGILASIGSSFIYISALGASGAIFGILGCLVILRPKGIAFVYGLPMPLWIAAFVWAFFDIAGLFAPSKTANLAHLIGLAVGLIYGLTIRKRFAERRKIRKREPWPDDHTIEEWEDHYMKK